MPLELTPEQAELAERSAAGGLWLAGPAGTGKTAVAAARLARLIEAGQAEAALVLVPQRTLGLADQQVARDPQAAPGGVVTVLTPGGLAKRMVELFWPLAAEAAGFAHPDRPPTFLTLETAQYHMARVVRPLIEQERYFDGVAIARHRLYSQVLDNLNKAASVGFSHDEVGARLKAAWIGEEAQLRVYDDVQDCAARFRQHCLAHNLLDFSLQLEVFRDHLWPQGACRDHLRARFRHLIADNVEEFTPVACDWIEAWVAEADSALLVHDDDAGHRVFLGADPQAAQELAEACQDAAALSESFVCEPEVHALEARLCAVLERASPFSGRADPRRALRFAYQRFHPQAVDWVAEEVARLVQEEDVPPGEIVVLAPFLSDALRFALRARLDEAGVPVQSHRPSRALLEEPATRCLLTWAALAHPDWGAAPTPPDVAHALQQSVADLDLVRAQLLAETLYRVEEGAPRLDSFDRLHHEMQTRVTYLLGARYEGLRIWLNDYRKRPPEPLDHCLRRLFGEVLSQVGYGFHRHPDAARVTANLVESVQKFRWALEPHGLDDAPLGQRYLELVREGVIAALYLHGWAHQAAEAVLLAPATTFLLANRPVRYQFWLNVNSTGWWERIQQPLTHPHVLSRRWAPGAPWTDAEETAVSQDALHRLLVGLLRRCRQGVFLALSELDEQGMDPRGPLLGAVQQVLRELAGEAVDA